MLPLLTLRLKSSLSEPCVPEIGDRERRQDDRIGLVGLAWRKLSGRKSAAAVLAHGRPC